MDMKKYVVGLFCGVAGAAVNMVFLLSAPGLGPEVFVSTGITWIVTGILISACDFKLKGFFRGMLVAVLVSASSLVYTFIASVSGGIWTLVSTIMVGAVMGYAVDRTGTI